MRFPSLSLPILAALPDPDLIRQKAAEVVSRPEFQLESGVERETITFWIRVLRWLLTPFSWLAKSLQGLPSPVWWLVVIVLSLLVVAIIVHLAWTILSAIKGPAKRRSAIAVGDQVTSVADLERAATLAESDGDYIGAVRLLFRASLQRIAKADETPLRRGITNHELLRRYRRSPLFEPLERFVDTIDAKWYGHESCGSEDCLDCRTEYSRICNVLERRSDAISA